MRRAKSSKVLEKETSLGTQGTEGSSLAIVWWGLGDRWGQMGQIGQSGLIPDWRGDRSPIKFDLGDVENN